MVESEDSFRDLFKSRLYHNPKMKRFEDWILNRPLHGGDLCEGFKERAIDLILATYLDMEERGVLDDTAESNLGSALWRIAEMKCAPE